jgi:hypothetical protein
VIKICSYTIFYKKPNMFFKNQLQLDRTKRNNTVQTDNIILVGNPFSMYIYLVNSNSVLLINIYELNISNNIIINSILLSVNRNCILYIFNVNINCILLSMTQFNT